MAEINVIKSENDNRSYKHLELGNHLQVLIISDPSTEKASAALDVNRFCLILNGLGQSWIL